MPHPSTFQELQLSAVNLPSSHFLRPQEHLDLSRFFFCLALLPVLVSRPDKRLEQRMRLQRLRLELRMKLAPNKMRMPRNLHHLNVCPIRSRPRNLQPGRYHRLFVLAIELIPVPMPLTDLRLSVNFERQRLRLDLAWPRPEPHRPTQFFYAAQFSQLVNHAVRSRLIELAGISIRQPANIACKLDASRLHPETNSEIRHLLLARILNRLQHSLDAPLAEPARYQDSVVPFKLRLVTFVSLVRGRAPFGFDPVQFKFQIVRQRSV